MHHNVTVMRTRFFLLPFLLVHTAIISQKHDYYWPMGYKTPFSDTTFGRTVIDFREDPPLIYKEDRELNFRSTMSSYCDSIGNLMFYTNGLQVMGSDHEEIENGGNLNTGYYANIDYSAGYKVLQSTIFLPKPSTDDTLYLFHESTDTNHIFSVARETLHQSKIDLAANNGLGKIVTKNSPLITDGTFGTITSSKHANGRDWWIFNSVLVTNRYNRLLFTDNGIEEIKKITFGDNMPLIPTLGITAFSPDGSKFIKNEVQHGVNIFDFDRCTGSFSNPVFIPLPNTDLGGGLAYLPIPVSFMFPLPGNYISLTFGQAILRPLKKPSQCTMVSNLHFRPPSTKCNWVPMAGFTSTAPAG